MGWGWVEDVKVRVALYRGTDVRYRACCCDSCVYGTNGEMRVVRRDEKILDYAM